MNLTRKQFAAIAPMADAETVEALFAPSADGQPEIDRIMAECKITEPSVVAQFLACCSLATDRFTKFHFGKLGVDIITWLSQPKETSTYVTQLTAAQIAINLSGSGIIGSGEIEQGRARDFYDKKLVDDSREWDWQTVVDCCAVIFPIATCAWLGVNDRLAEVCAALGVTDKSEAGAISDEDWLLAQ